MVTHVVLFKLKDCSGATARAVQEKLLGMKGLIPGLLEVEAGVDYSRSDRSFDVALITRHASKEALDVYQVHPVHEAVKEFIAGVRDASISVDFDL